MGVPALVFLGLFFCLPFFQAGKLYLRGHIDRLAPIMRMCMYTAIIGIPGYVLSAQFVSIEFLEIPYYIVLLLAGSFKVAKFEQQSIPTMMWVPNSPQTA